MDTAASRKKKSAGAPGWVMTFADLMSILLSFFVLLLSFSEMDVAKYKQIAGSMREAFGVQRKYRVKEPPKGINVIAKEFSAGRPDPTPFNVMEQMTTDEMKRNLDTGDKRLKKSDGAEQHSDSGKDAADRHRDDALKAPDDQLVVMPKAEAEEIIKARERAERRQRLEQTAAQMRAALAKEIEGGQIDIETEDEKIVIRIREKASFASGGVDLRDSFRPVLVRVAQILQDTPGRIAIVGHTDNVPMAEGLFRSNWDLSAARAVSVLHGMLESVQLDPARFSVQGAGETQPLVDNDTPANRARNRRVEIILKQGEDLEASHGISSGLVPVPDASAGPQSPEAGAAAPAGEALPEPAAQSEPLVQSTAGVAEQEEQ
ncbi:flagellar motor protein [Thiohalobacter thiocyanaticus]|uniref:Flagellar motor protein n=1 Tax=Thiohalobacter thiocyanaticus TaxID=585455 RepID=A0A1Z4VTL9_9GAMM|nr:MotB family protein [Thiohalobacter thiocyanaticus]BAZ94990.1 flagellar motor protein [Thiohalobacter thiocyanaticus]